MAGRSFGSARVAADRRIVNQGDDVVVEIDLQSETTRENLSVTHVGFARDELRVVFDSPGGKAPLVLELKGIHSFFDRGLANSGAVVIARIAEPGSFGWYLSAEDRAKYREVHINRKADPIDNLFRVIARSVRTRMGDNEDRNFPG